MSIEGRIIEFLDSDQLRMGYVRKQEGAKLHIIDPRGRNVSAPSDRVVIVHALASESAFPSTVREINDRIATRQSEIDIELLWQSVNGNHMERASSELARIYFGDDVPEAASAIFRSLSEDTLYFRRKGVQFTPKTPEQVDVEVLRRQRQKEREEFRAHASAAIRGLVRDKNAAVTPELEPIIDRIDHWLRERTGDEVGTLLEEIAGIAKARDAACDILVRAGRVDSHADRFLVMAGIDGKFSEPLLEAADGLNPHVHGPDRLDLRHLPAFTIDDDDTREVDDALTIEHRDGETIIGIHIADISAFVSKGDLLDAEAYRRSSSIYLPAETVRMFPDRLSTDLASLTAGTERPAFTVEVRFDGQGDRLGYRIVLSTIQVAERLSYDSADEAIQAGDPGLSELHRIAVRLQAVRRERGAITFRRAELKIRVRGNQIDVSKLNPDSPSRLLVSEMMILANSLAAGFASLHSLPVIFRTQDARDALAVEDTPAIEALAFDKLRKTFKRSRLSLAPGTHSGLGLTAYTQASSPIRRYADLVTQRQFTAMLSSRTLPYVREELLQILATAEAAEQEVRAIEDKSTTYWLLEFLAREKTGQPLPAIVMDKRGTVELEDYYLRGKIAETATCSLGTSVQVMIETIDPARGDVRFKLAASPVDQVTPQHG